MVMKKCEDPEDTICLRDELYKVENYSGLSGIISFDENGDVIKPTAIRTVKNGKFMDYE